MIDSVMRSVWNAKDSIAKECDYNPAKLAEMLKSSELAKNVNTVDYHMEKRTSQYSVRSTSSRR